MSGLASGARASTALALWAPGVGAVNDRAGVAWIAVSLSGAGLFLLAYVVHAARRRRRPLDPAAIPDDVYARLERQAQRDHRSVNAQIVYLIERGTAGTEEAQPMRAMHHINGDTRDNRPENLAVIDVEDWSGRGRR